MYLSRGKLRGQGGGLHRAGLHAIMKHTEKGRCRPKESEMKIDRYLAIAGLLALRDRLQREGRTVYTLTDEESLCLIE